MMTFRSTSYLALLLAGTVYLPVAQAAPPYAIQCGDVLGPGGSYVLSEDLDCDVGPALTVLEGAKLNLKGHTVTCNAELDLVGIKMDGQGASVTNGTILDCDAGVWLSGSGGHSVSRIEYARSNPGQFLAFLVPTNGNRLVRNSATGCDECFEISGDDNRLMHNL